MSCMDSDSSLLLLSAPQLSSPYSLLVLSILCPAPDAQGRPHPYPPCLPSLPTIQLGPHVDVEIQMPFPANFPSSLSTPSLQHTPTPTPPLVEINDILDLLPPTPLHHPIVPIKRHLVAQKRIPSRLGAERRGRVEESEVVGKEAWEARCRRRGGRAGTEAAEREEFGAGAGWSGWGGLGIG